MMVPPGTSCPPKALKPNRCAFESRPFREVPCPHPERSEGSAVGLDALLLLFRRSFLWRRLFGCSLFLGWRLVSLRLGFNLCRLHRFHLLRLGDFLGKLGSGELLPIKGNFSNPNRGISLTMSAQLLVLLLAFVMEDKNLFLPVLWFSTRMTSPGATRYCFPPVRITAYMLMSPKFRRVRLQRDRSNVKPSRRTLARSAEPDDFQCLLLSASALSATMADRLQNGAASTGKPI